MELKLMCMNMSFACNTTVLNCFFLIKHFTFASNLVLMRIIIDASEKNN